MVMEAMPDYQQAVKSLDELRATYDSEMTRAEKDFDKQFAEYVDGLRSFPDNILLKRQKELQQLMTQTIDFKDEAKRMLKDAERQVMEPVEKRLQEAVDALGSEKNYDFIVNTDNNSYPFVNKAKAEDINNLLIERLK
jgi:outer membrane protein